MNNPAPVEAENTLFTYMYRCGANWKDDGFVVFGGRPDEAKVAALMSSLDDKNFIAKQIGVPDVFPWAIGTGDYDAEFDHCWHEICTIEATDKAPTDSRSAADFIDQVLDQAKEGWKVFDPDPEAVWG